MKTLAMLFLLPIMHSSVRAHSQKPSVIMLLVDDLKPAFEAFSDGTASNRRETKTTTLTDAACKVDFLNRIS
jgi:hypothetical protein